MLICFCILAQVGLFCGQEIENVSSCTPSRNSSEDTTTSIVFLGVFRARSPLCRFGSPPWREDDKDGHYVFRDGETLTSRCKYTLPSFMTLGS
ncbi:putative dual-specificity kinase [Lupinus albus]|uniref:Putative dual-specificity kinase n=1 Tax=Lupinus albus TaxID=3870 RepID=A0A6A4PIN3_LUPAL|nr:putative dual-specificity kinase [Lupinus albus]